MFQKLFFWMFVMGTVVAYSLTPSEENELQDLRTEMVEEQIEERGVRDGAVLEAMAKVERHLFVSDEYTFSAYSDTPLPIGSNQTISQPYIVGLMTDLADIKEGERCLEIGTGSGYQAAVLSEICEEVFTIEIIEELSVKAKVLLEDILETENISFKIGDGHNGWSENAPFDVILVTAAPLAIPNALIEQLSPEGGRMIIPVGGSYQELIRVVRTGNKVEQERIIPVRFVPMTRDVR